MKYRILFYFLFSSLYGWCQLNPIGTWTEHLPFQSGTSIATNGTLVYVGTTTGLFTYNSLDQSISRYSKVNLLSEVNIQQLNYNPHNGSLIIVYESANIDLIKGDQVINLPFVKDKAELTDKSIYEISFFGNKALLSFAFGIVEINTDRAEITDSYIFGNNGNIISVSSSTIFQDSIYAATNSGIYAAAETSNLLDFNSWKILPHKSNLAFKKLFQFNNSLYAVAEIQSNGIDSVFQINPSSFSFIPELSKNEIHGCFVESTTISIASDDKIETFDPSLAILSTISESNVGVNGIVRTSNNNMYRVDTYTPLKKYHNGFYAGNIRPNGPFEKGVFDITVTKDGTVWAVPGGVDGAYNSAFIPGRIYKLENGSWTSYVDYAIPSLNGKYDIMSITANPENSNDVYFGTFGTGLIQYNGGSNFTTYDDNNSSIQQRQDVVWDWTGVPSIAFDENNAMWVTNTYTTNILSARINGNWYRYNFSAGLTSGNAVTELLISQSGLKWVAMPRDNAILVFDDNKSPTNGSDDRFTILTSEVGKGNIPGIAGITMAEDKDGQIWVGTSDGIAVFFNPDNVFGANHDAQRILIEGAENVEELLAGTIIKDIEIDGANQKWIATDGSGVYLLSEDGTKEVQHFTEENSPLLSNTVFTIAIDQNSGEVYFGTGNGIISYRGAAIEGKDNFANVNIFPNPVQGNYEGDIAISGLMDNTTIKITDINGSLVNELKSNGGTSLWNGKNFNGERVNTGVYLIFNSAENDKKSLKTNIGKILFIN